MRAGGEGRKSQSGDAGGIKSGCAERSRAILEGDGTRRRACSRRSHGYLGRKNQLLVQERRIGGRAQGDEGGRPGHDLCKRRGAAAIETSIADVDSSDGVRRNGERARGESRLSGSERGRTQRSA